MRSFSGEKISFLSSSHQHIIRRWLLQVLQVRASTLTSADRTCFWTNLWGFDKRLCHFAVSSSVAGGDEVRHAAAFQEGVRTHLAFAEHLCEGHHLHEAQSDHRCLGVVPKTETVTESGPYCHDVLGIDSLVIFCGVDDGGLTCCVRSYLQSSTQLHRVALLHHGDAKVSGLQQLFKDQAVGHISGSWRK